MGKKKNFFIIPLDIDTDPRLQPWLCQHGINGHEIIWAVERMIARLAEKPERKFTVSELTTGIYNKHLPYRALKEIILYSGFFHLEAEYIKYDWERFAQNPVSNPNKEADIKSVNDVDSPSISRQSPVNPPSTTPARDLKATNVDIDVDNYDEDKEKEKKEKAAARISQLVDEWVIDPREENMPEREDVRRWMTWLLDLREGQAPYLLSKKCAIPNIKERWYDLVVSFAEHLALNGGFKEIKNYTTAQKYMSRVFTTNGRDGKLEKFFPGVFIQNQFKEEEEAAHKAWVEEEKQRFPFEDYDPERGTRYVGNELIPWDAPPRPDNSSRWDYEECRWVSWEEQMAERSGETQAIREVMEIFQRKQAELMKESR